MEQTFPYLKSLSAVDYVQGAACFLLLLLSAASIVWFAPFRSNLEQAQRTALDRLKGAGDLEISINLDGSLRKIPLPMDRKFNLDSFRTAAEKYISFIDSLNRQLKLLLARDAFLFLILTWIASTAFAIIFLNLLTRILGEQPVNVTYFVRDMNENAVRAYLQAPPIAVDPIPGKDVDRLAVVPYSIITKFLLSGLGMFVFKLAFLLRPKFVRTRRMLRALVLKADADLTTQLEKMRQARDDKTEPPWFRSA